MSNFAQLINSILSNEVFKHKPPVLIDIGASGEIFEKWSLIADKSICIAFDADERDFSYDAVDKSTGYLKMYKFNRIVLPVENAESKFYLTKNPHCSSTLQPNTDSLKDWSFASLFEVDKTINLPAVTINECLKNINIDYIDWYKVDSQGIDKDIFLSISKDIRDNILAADFEPGIMNAYLNENKLAGLLAMLDSESYWISTFDIRKIQRLDEQHNSLSSHLESAPAWAGITSLKEINDKLTLRSALLLIVFGLIERQWGYALQVCKSAKHIDPEFQKIHENILSQMKSQDKNFAYKVKRRLKNFVKKAILG